jgi:hypothetical protein
MPFLIVIGNLNERQPRLRDSRALASVLHAVGAYGLAVAAGEAGRRGDLEAFETRLASPDQSLWSESRIREFAASAGRAAGSARRSICARLRTSASCT